MTEPVRVKGTEQLAYDLGYYNPALPPKRLAWEHLTQVNAFYRGQLDRQNQQPQNPAYRLH